LVLLYIIAFWAIVTGVLEIVAAIRGTTAISNELGLVIGGVLSVVFGVVLLIAPGAAALAVVFLKAVRWCISSTGFPHLGAAIVLDRPHLHALPRAAPEDNAYERCRHRARRLMTADHRCAARMGASII